MDLDLVRNAFFDELQKIADERRKEAGIIDAIKRDPGKAMDYGGLAVLGAIPADHLQAHLRTAPGEAWEHKSLMGGETGHAIGDIVGLGTLAAGIRYGKH